MKKEVLIAILLGLVVGLVITYGLYRVRTSISQPPVAELTQLATSAAVLTQASSTAITILNPEEGAVLSERALRVTGTTSSDSYIVLFVNDEDYVSTTDETGNFSFEVTLENGVNVLRVHVVDTEGTTTTAERVVVVSSIFQDGKAPEASASAATDDSETEATASEN
jgi:hypothetical protein